jgi:GDP/UDP-N,N'-diacetylbacillosamine 2-epimerase (hydrolysing)
MIKICVVTGTRADYGLLMPLMKAISASTAYELQLLVTGMHLSPEFGLTYQQIQTDGFRINEKVEILLSADTDTAIVKSTGLGLIGFADSFDRLLPDWILLLGDRFETFAAATCAYLKKIPIIHIHGGETTAGATDEALRHAITKMATLHFTTTEEYRTRVLQLGEPGEQVFNVGAIGLDNIFGLPLLNKEDVEKLLAVSLSGDVFLVTYHPVTLEQSGSGEQFQSLLDALDEWPDAVLIFTMPNADADGRIIIEMVRNYVQKHKERAMSFTSLGQLRYLSLMRHASVVVGNSSSGIIEAPSFGIPTVNIGDRQKGRIAADSVIHCEPEKNAIKQALKKAFDPQFRAFSTTVENPYGNGNTTKKIMEVLKRKIAHFNLKKQFVDRSFDE